MESGMVATAPSLAQEVQAQTERDCETWQELITAQDDFVASLLENRAALQHRLAEAHKELLEGDTDSRAREEEWHRLERIAQLEADVAHARESYQERIKAQDEAERTLAKLDAQLAQLEAQASTGPRVESHKADVRPKSPPFALAFVNGTVAPFSDALIQKGTAGGREASSLLRGQIEFDLSSLSTEGEVTVLCFLYYDRLQLVPSLERNRVISNPSTWRNFLDGFSRVTGNFVVDAANSLPAEQHVASILSKLGFMANLKQVYLVGVRPEQGVRDLVERMPDPTGALAEHFVDQVMPKIELVRHLPHHQMGELANATIEFAGLFESSVAVPFADRTQASVSQRAPPPPPSTSGGGAGARPAQPRDSSRATSSRGDPKLKIDPHRGLLHQEPAICFHHYISTRGCTKGKCSRSHDYELTEGQLRRQ